MTSSKITSTKNVILGNKAEISWTPTDASLYYKLTYSIGKWRYTTSPIKPNSSFIGQTFTWNQNIMYLSLAEQIPSSKSGVVTVYLYTYSNSSCTVQIGTTSSKTFVVTVPDSMKPIVNTVSATIVNDNATIRGWNIAVAGYTKIKLNASATSQYGATIVSYTISGPYNTSVNGSVLSYTGGAVQNSGVQTLKIIATDSRGCKSEPKEISTTSFYSYSKPFIDSVSIQRTTDSEDYGKISAVWEWSDLDGRNSCRCQVKARRKSESVWTTVTNNLPNGTPYVFTGPPASDQESAWIFSIVVSDSVGNKVEYLENCSTASVLLDFKAGGNGLGIGKIAEKEGYMEVALGSVFKDKVKIIVNNSSNENSVEIPLSTYISTVVNNCLVRTVDYTWDNAPITQLSGGGAYYTGTGIKLSQLSANPAIQKIVGVVVTHWEGAMASFTPYIQGEDTGDLRIRLFSDISQTVRKVKLRVLYIGQNPQYIINTAG